MQKGLYRSDCSLRPDRTSRLVQDLYWFVKVNGISSSKARKALQISFMDLHCLYQGKKAPDDELAKRIRAFIQKEETTK